MKRKSLVSAVLLAASGLFAGTAQALPTETFDLNVSAGGYMSSGSAGTVTLTQASATEVDVSVVLSPDFYFMKNGPAHDSFAFNINLATPPVVVNSIVASPPFVVGPLNQSETGAFGTMSNTIDCTGCANGGKTTNPTSLSFHVTDAAGISFANFVANSGGSAGNFFFTADIFNNSATCTTTGACTGIVGAVGAVPEPETYGMLLAGLGLMGFVARRRKQASA